MTDAAIPKQALRSYPSFLMFWNARVATNAAYTMQLVAIGWQMYDLTHSAFDLGMIGVAQFFPLIVMGIVGGQIADHYDRRRVAAFCQVSKAFCALVLAVLSARGWITREAILAIVFVFSTARSLEIPTLHAILPSIVPQAVLPRAIAASATAQQTAIICGPALGGFLYLLGPQVVYAVCAAAFVAASVLISLVTLMPRTSERKPVTLRTVFAGFVYLRAQPLILGAISLDLFVVLVGGVTALLPIFARDILQTGPWGLGLLRAAPAVGALLMSIWLARHTIERAAGRLLFASVTVFGLAILAFALSTSLVFSFTALVVYGAADAVSVVIRHSLVQMRTPNDMLGRVMAVNTVFTGTSTALGEAESGFVAGWLGAVASAFIGGIGAIVIAGLWWKGFPQLARIERLAPDP